MFENVDINTNKSKLTDTTNNLIKLIVIGGLGFGVYKLGVYKGWWTPKKYKRVANEWDFFNKLPYEITLEQITDLFTDRFNTMKGKKYEYKKYLKVDPLDQFDPILNDLKNANNLDDFLNIYSQFNAQVEIAQLNDFVFEKTNKYPFDFIKNKLKDDEITKLSIKTFLKLPPGISFFTDQQGNYIWEKNLYIFK